LLISRFPVLWGITCVRHSIVQVSGEELGARYRLREGEAQLRSTHHVYYYRIGC